MIFSFSAIQPQVCNKTVSVIVRCNSIGNISVSSDKIISNFISNQLINCYVMPVMLFDRNHIQRNCDWMISAICVIRRTWDASATSCQIT